MAADWGTFDEARRACQAAGADGIGFVLTHEDPYIGIDLDHVIEDDRLTATVRTIVDRCASYTEYSPSGNGLHILVKGTLPKAVRRSQTEIYSAGRFLTVTGNVLPNSSLEIHHRQNAIEWLLATYGAATASQGATHAPNAVPAGLSIAPSMTLQRDGPPRTDAEIIGLLLCRPQSPSARLWRGDTSAYHGDASRADMTLIGMIARHTCEADQIERIFARCALAKRPKWQTRADYRARTIATAITNAQQWHQVKH